MRFERIAPEAVEWGLTLCSRKACAELAEARFEGWPLCLEHAGDAWERAVAFELAPAAVRELFPALEERG